MESYAPPSRRQFQGKLLAFDGGPVPRRFLIRIDGFFGCPTHTTLPNKLSRRQVAERAVQAAVKGLPKGILHGFSWSNEVELHTPRRETHFFNRP